MKWAFFVISYIFSLQPVYNLLCFLHPNVMNLHQNVMNLSDFLNPFSYFIYTFARDFENAHGIKRCNHKS